SHAWAADRMGDPTAKYLGRITLNPIKHIDLWGTIIIPLFLIITHAGFLVGWAKPVPINPNNFHDRKKGEIYVSIAGPLANLAIAIIAGLGLRFLLKADFPNNILLTFLYYTFAINVLLFVFNLIPIPPLDGSHILENMLSYKAKMVYNKIAPFSFILIFLLFPILGPLFRITLKLFSLLLIGDAL
ncbi:site-2 protease family protein, partial [bacterium]|nr:site-2 protease family protein [bacterium]